jgi:hypothetical protein
VNPMWLLGAVQWLVSAAASCSPLAGWRARGLRCCSDPRLSAAMARLARADMRNAKRARRDPGMGGDRVEQIAAHPTEFCARKSRPPHRCTLRHREAPQAWTAMGTQVGPRWP